MRILFVAILFCIATFSCTESPEKKFSKNGISFTCPKGWIITEEEDYNNEGYYLSLEKEGITSSGLLTVTWINDSLDLYSYLEVFQTELKNNVIYKHTDLSFDPSIPGIFNSDTTLSTTYGVSILGVGHRGIIHAFYGKGKTIAILKQEALEDIKSNKIGFSKIEESFVHDSI